MDQTGIVLIAVAVVVAVIVIALVLATRRRRGEDRSARIRGMRERYGGEYDRQTERLGSPDAAENLLTQRSQQVHQRDLSPSERSRYREDWDRIEGRFLDRPALAVAEAERLVSDLMRDRGYRTDDPQDAAVDLSVTHHNLADRFRSGSQIVASGTTEIGDLREAMLHFRTVVDQLLAVDVRGERRRVE